MRIKYLISFLKLLFINNPVKSIFIILALIIITFLTSFKDTVYQYDIINKIKINNIDYYIYYNPDVDGLSINKESEDYIVKNNKLFIYEYNIINILAYAIFIIIFIFIFIVTFSGDNEWEYDECREEAFTSLIRCELENGVYYYFVGNKLIQKENNQIYRYYKIRKFSELKKCPEYYSKKKLRNDKLNKLNI